MDFAHRRKLGYLDTLKSRGIAPEPLLMSAGEMTEEHGFNTTARYLSLPNPPTAILASSMISALGVRRAIESAGLEMGRDVSVITHDDVLSYLRNGGDVPIFTATRSSVRDAGRKVAAMLLDRIAQSDAPDQQLLLEAELMVGQSTGPAPTTAP